MSCYIITFLLKSVFAACFFNKTIIQSVKSLLNHKLNPLKLKIILQYNEYRSGSKLHLLKILHFEYYFDIIVIHFT